MDLVKQSINELELLKFEKSTVNAIESIENDLDLHELNPDFDIGIQTYLMENLRDIILQSVKNK